MVSNVLKHKELIEHCLEHHTILAHFCLHMTVLKYIACSTANKMKVKHGFHQTQAFQHLRKSRKWHQTTSWCQSEARTHIRKTCQEANIGKNKKEHFNFT